MKSLNPDMDQQKLTSGKHVTIFSKKKKETDILLAIYIAIHSLIKNIDHFSEIYNRISKENSVSLHKSVLF